MIPIKILPLSHAAAVKASGSLHIQQPSSKWQHAVKGAVRFEQVVKESVIVLQIMEQNTRRLLKVRCSLCMQYVFGPAAPGNLHSQAGLVLHSCHACTLTTAPVNYRPHGGFAL